MTSVVCLKGYMAFQVILLSYVFFFISIPFIPLLFLYAGSLPGTAGSEFSGSTPSMLYHVSTPSSNDNSSFKENQPLK
jgi:hypothetical protein